MDEADKLADRIAIIDRGKVIALDSSANLKNKVGGDVINIETTDPEAVQKFVEKCKFCKEAKRHDGKVTISTDHAEKKIPELISLAEKNKVKIISVSINKPTLEDVFLYYTGKTIREQEASSIEHLRERRRMHSR